MHTVYLKYSLQADSSLVQIHVRVEGRQIHVAQYGTTAEVGNDLRLTYVSQQLFFEAVRKIVR